MKLKCSAPQYGVGCFFLSIGTTEDSLRRVFGSGSRAGIPKLAELGHSMMNISLPPSKSLPNRINMVLNMISREAAIMFSNAIEKTQNIFGVWRYNLRVEVIKSSYLYQYSYQICKGLFILFPLAAYTGIIVLRQAS